MRKRRTKVIWSSDSEHPEVVLALPATVSSKSESTEASCLSSTSSAASSARSCYEIRSMKRNQMESCENPKRRKVDSGYGSGSSYMRRQAEKILDFLSRGSSSEVRIRQVLGDSPDTSKALRMWDLSLCMCFFCCSWCFSFAREMHVVHREFFFFGH